MQIDATLAQVHSKSSFLFISSIEFSDSNRNDFFLHVKMHFNKKISGFQLAFVSMACSTWYNTNNRAKSTLHTCKHTTNSRKTVKSSHKNINFEAAGGLWTGCKCFFLVLIFVFLLKSHPLCEAVKWQKHSDTSKRNEMKQVNFLIHRHVAGMDICYYMVQTMNHTEWEKELCDQIT